MWLPVESTCNNIVVFLQIPKFAQDFFAHAKGLDINNSANNFQLGVGEKLQSGFPPSSHNFFTNLSPAPDNFFDQSAKV
jgi:hypothetical protein